MRRMQTSSSASQHDKLQRVSQDPAIGWCFTCKHLRCLPFTECLIWQLLEDQFNRAYIWHQIQVSQKAKSDPLVFFLLPKNMWKLRGWSRTMVEVDCQSFSGVPFFKKYRHITLAKDYTLITFPKGRYAANMQRFC